MASKQQSQVEILSERSKIPADGKTATKLCIRFEHPEQQEVTVKLHKRGSFSASEIVREATFPIKHGEINFVVYAPNRPGHGFVTGEGFRYRLEFVAASFVQGLVFEWVPTLFWALVLALILRNYAVATFYIPSGSMEDTLLKRDLLIADKLSYKVFKRDPQRGDIMIFQYPEDRKLDYIKRVIGLPGDRIEVRQGTVYVNGEALEEDTYIKERPLRPFPPMTVPDDHYFMMGDNRNQSQDSRAWGTVPRSYFEGRALFVFWPPNRVHVIQHHYYNDIGE